MRLHSKLSILALSALLSVSTSVPGFAAVVRTNAAASSRESESAAASATAVIQAPSEEAVTAAPLPAVRNETSPPDSRTRAASAAQTARCRRWAAPSQRIGPYCRAAVRFASRAATPSTSSKTRGFAARPSMSTTRTVPKLGTTVSSTARSFWSLSKAALFEFN